MSGVNNLKRLEVTWQPFVHFDNNKWNLNVIKLGQLGPTNLIVIDSKSDSHNFVILIIPNSKSDDEFGI